MKQQRGIVIYQRDVVTAQCCRVGTHRHPEEVVCCLALLGDAQSSYERQEESEKTFFHLFCPIIWQSYTFFQKSTLILQTISFGQPIIYKECKDEREPYI